MDFGVGRVCELVGHVRALDPGDKLFGLGNGALHAERALGKHQLCAERLEDFTAFLAHGFGHGEDEPVPFCRGDEGEGDAGVAAGRLDDDAIFCQYPPAFGVQDHGEADAVFYARQRVLEFELCGDDGAALVQFVDAHERRVSNERGNVRSEVHKACLPTALSLIVLLNYYNVDYVYKQFVFNITDF